MIARRLSCLALVLIHILGVASGPALAQTLLFDGFAPPLRDGVQVLDGPGADGLTGVRFEGGHDWPALRFSATRPLDWTADAALALPVDNPGAAPFTLLLRLDDDPRADGGDRSLTGLVTLAPHAHGTVVLPLGAGPGGMLGRPPGAGPPRPGDISVSDLRGAVDARHIVALHVSGLRDAGDRELRIGVPQLRANPLGPSGSTKPAVPGPIADRFGQAIAGDWPEKVRDEADLRRKRDAAAVQTSRLARDAPPPAGRFGGSGPAAGPATGFFRVEKAAGHWRLVSPDGRPFFSLGVDAVTPSNPTVVAGRRGLFDGLPMPNGPLGGFFAEDAVHGRTFDIGAANLMRALGPDWRARWSAEVIRRLKAWGFNTLGNWSDERLAASGLASVTFYDVEGDSGRVPMAGGRHLPDPFDSRYPAVADAVATAMTAAYRDTPALLGYFSGNEMPWGRADRPAEGIAAGVLALGGESPAKRAFVDDLRTRYGTVAAWARAWNASRIAPAAASWAQLLDAPLPLPDRLSAAALADITAFQSAFAARYFATVAQAIRRHDKNHLYLGTRFGDAPPEVIAACARWCDVLSFNVYGASPEDAAARWRGLDRPVLIGEFHFGSTDRGSFWPGMMDAGSEDRRGPAYAAYLEAARRDPAIVGLHWYQYADEPLTGRPYDGENGHIGLVAVTDVPYAGFVAAVAAANRRALQSLATGSVRETAGTVP